MGLAIPRMMLIMRGETWEVETEICPEVNQQTNKNLRN